MPHYSAGSQTRTWSPSQWGISTGSSRCGASTGMRLCRWSKGRSNAVMLWIKHLNTLMPWVSERQWSPSQWRMMVIPHGDNQLLIECWCAPVTLWSRGFISAVTSRDQRPSGNPDHRSALSHLSSSLQFYFSISLSSYAVSYTKMWHNRVVRSWTVVVLGKQKIQCLKKFDLLKLVNRVFHTHNKHRR